MTNPEIPHPACCANEARVRASGINLTTEYGKWVLQLAMTSKIHMCLARKGDGFLCVQAGEGAGHRCQLHGGASRGPKTQEGRARAAANLRQNRMRGPTHWRSEPVIESAGPAVSPTVDGLVLGEYLSQAELVTLTGKKRGGAQCTVLRDLGIPFILRSRVPIVSRVLVQQAMAGAGGAR